MDERKIRKIEICDDNASVMNFFLMQATIISSIDFTADAFLHQYE